MCKNTYNFIYKICKYSKYLHNVICKQQIWVESPINCYISLLSYQHQHDYPPFPSKHLIWSLTTPAWKIICILIPTVILKSFLKPLFDGIIHDNIYVNLKLWIHSNFCFGPLFIMLSSALWSLVLDIFKNAFFKSNTCVKYGDLFFKLAIEDFDSNKAPRMSIICGENRVDQSSL